MLIELMTQLDKILYNVHEQYDSFPGMLVWRLTLYQKKGVLLFLCSKEPETQVNKRILAAVAAKKLTLRAVSREEQNVEVL